MTKKVLLITLALIVILVFVAACMIWYFLSPGVHFLFGHIHLDISESGYIMNENGELLGEATFTAQGFALNAETVSDGKFELSLTGFPVISKEDSCGALAYQSNGTWTVIVSKPNFTTEPGTNNPVIERAAKYEIYIDKTSGSILTCCVYGLKDIEGTYYFIPAEHQQDASQYIEKVLGS